MARARSSTVALVLAAWAWAESARACPACAQASANDGAALWAVGLFLLVPFAVALAAAWALRGLARVDATVTAERGVSPRAEG